MIRIYSIEGTIFGSPIFGNPQMQLKPSQASGSNVGAFITRIGFWAYTILEL